MRELEAGEGGRVHERYEHEEPLLSLFEQNIVLLSHSNICYTSNPTYSYNT